MQVLSTLLLFVAGEIIFAQPTYHANLLTPENGLPQSTNDFIFQDSRGYIWISSVNGLAVFDGLHTRNLQADTADSCAIKEGNIQSHFFEDGVGQIWFTSSHYLHRYQPKTDCFEAFQPGNSGESEYSIRLIGIEKNRWLWGVANGGIFYFDTHFPVHEYEWTCQRTESFRFVVDTLPNGRFSTLLGCLWNSKDGIEVFSIGANRIVEYKGIQLMSLNGMSLTVVNGCSIGINDYWLSTNQGLVHWNQGKKTIYAPPEGIISMYSPPLYWDKNTILTGIGKKLWRLDISTGEFTPLLLPELAKDKVIHYLYKDQNNNLWAGIKGFGVLFCSMQFIDLFEHIPYPNNTGIPSSISAHPTTKQPALTFLGKGVWQYFDDTFTPWNNALFNYMLASNDKMVFLDAPDGIYTLAVGASEPDLLIPTEEEVHGIWSNYKQIFFTTPDKFIQSHLDYPKILDTLTGLSFVYNLEIDQEHQEVLISSTNGIFSYEWNSVKNKIGPLIKKIETPIIPVTSLLDTLNNCYWVGSRQDLLRIDRTTKKVETLSELTGMKVNHWVCAIEQDDMGYIWFSSHTGIYRYDPKRPTRLPRGFTTREGLSNIEYEDRLSLKTPDGRLWFGHANGLDVISPEQYQEETSPPQIALNDFWVMGKPYPNRNAIFEYASVTLPHYNNAVTFKMAALDYVNPQKNTFWVTLEGHDKDTTFLGNQQEVTYPNLDPGDYTFSFSATNAAGIRNPEFKQMQVRITPPFWQTWWFRTLSGIILLAIVFLIIKAYINRRLREQRFALEKKQMRLENEARLQAERNRIADELHDDLGGKLSTILFAGKRMMRFNKISDAQVLMQKVSGLSLELIESMKSIIWAMDTDHDQLSSLFAAIRNYSAQFGEDNELDISINISPLIEDFVVHGLIRHNVLLTIKECLNNSLKHAQATKLSLKGHLKGNDLMVSITDNGQGFDVKATQNKGKGLKSLQKRMKKVNGQINWQSFPQSGTLVSIIVPLPEAIKP